MIYRLPKVLTSKFIFIVEGEKDVETLERLGFTVTTNPGGSGKWVDGYANCFNENQTVTIIPDNDKPGIEHARKWPSRFMGELFR